MEREKYYKKIAFWLRFAGWLCLLPASVLLYLYQIANEFIATSYSYLFLVELIIFVLFAVFLLTMAKSPIWRKKRNLLFLLVFDLIFVSLIIDIPLYFAYNNCRKLNS